MVPSDVLRDEGCHLSAGDGRSQGGSRYAPALRKLAATVLAPLFLLGVLLLVLGRYEQRSADGRYWRLHRVRQGEDLRQLAGRYYRNPALWTLIFQANRRRLVGREGLYEAEIIFIPPLEAVRR